jgi:hypothetical protein
VWWWSTKTNPVQDLNLIVRAGLPRSFLYTYGNKIHQHVI